MLSARFLLHCVVKVPLVCTWIGIVMWFVARSVWLNQMQNVGVVLFEVIATENWERRVSEWLADYWSCVVDDFVPVGISCGCLLSVGGLLEGDGGRRGLQLNPVQLCFILQIVTSAGSSVFDGQEVHAVMDFLLVKLRDCLTDPVLLSCPALLRVSEILYLVVNCYC